MKTKFEQITLPAYLIALVWLTNGLFCKVLNQVPRHREIVSNILGEGIATTATIVIGILEIFMTVWILSRIERKLCAITQIVIVITMNIIEFLLVPDLLLFGQFNILIAFVFCVFIFYSELIRDLHPR